MVIPWLTGCQRIEQTCITIGTANTQEIAAAVRQRERERRATESSPPDSIRACCPLRDAAAT
ncbi:MAG: hypothetical protein ACJASX_003621 [Limisphaerales bacterium]|jgi:hypothetical protein